MTLELTEKFGVYFYLDLNPENVYLGISGDNLSGPVVEGERCGGQKPDRTSDFQVTLGSLKRAFQITNDTSEVHYLYPDQKEK